jgi:4,5-DOPA dioxygenase extradiol
MDRREALKLLSLAPLGLTLRPGVFASIMKDLPASPRMPVLFLGHGSPMNALEDNEFSRGWRNMARNLPRPAAILCISAHWETRGTFVTGMEKPRTIHDFGGFPQELFAVRYPAPGSSELVLATQQAVTSAHIHVDHEWGLDHGAWSVIMHLFPKADIPVVQMSLDRDLSPRQHLDLAAQLRMLRRKGVLIVGSGNIVHNLGIIDWKRPDGGHDWALEANEKLKGLILSNDHGKLAAHGSLGRAVQLAIPTAEHYLPLLYVLAQKEQDEKIDLFNDRVVMGSISMTSLVIG